MAEGLLGGILGEEDEKPKVEAPEALASADAFAAAVAARLCASDPEKGPHWADPLKAWGDVLAKQGKTKEALAKYEEALKYAPNWKELKVQLRQ
jgi:predicted negative regulator of RcsB-dependent stress response